MRYAGYIFTQNIAPALTDGFRRSLHRLISRETMHRTRAHNLKSYCGWWMYDGRTGTLTKGSPTTGLAGNLGTWSSPSTAEMLRTRRLRYLRPRTTARYARFLAVSNIRYVFYFIRFSDFPSSSRAVVGWFDHPSCRSVKCVATCQSIELRGGCDVVFGRATRAATLSRGSSASFAIQQ